MKALIRLLLGRRARVFGGAERVQNKPDGYLVLESDAPFLAPEPYRGETNRAVWLTRVAAQLAALRGWSAEETASVTTANAQRLLRL